MSELAASLEGKGRLLGLDVGSKTLGLAISDADMRVASPIGTAKRSKFTADAEALKSLIKQREVQGLVFGLPLNMDGSTGPQAQSTKQFARNLESKAEVSLPYLFWDERLSSAAVERILVKEADMSRAKRSEKIDHMAAAFILQGALDAI